jgi:Zn-finger nucleic acid-binding protein
MLMCNVCNIEVEESNCATCRKKIEYYKCPKCGGFITNPEYHT